MRRTESVRGVVEDPAGHPVSDAVVKIEREQGDGAVIGPFPRTAVTAPDGTFAFDAVDKGTHMLTASHQLYPDAVQRGVIATRSVRLVFKVASTLSGIVAGSSGKPATNFNMFVARDPETPGGGTLLPQQPELTTYPFRDPKGEFSIGPLRPGTYKLTAIGADGSTGQLPAVALREGENKRNLRLTLLDGRTVTAEIRDFATGQPLSGAIAELRLPAGPVLRAEADGSGRLTLQNVPRLDSLAIMLRGPDRQYVTESRWLPQGSGGSSVDLGLVQLVGKADDHQKDIGYAPLAFLGSSGSVTVGRTMNDSPATQMGFKTGDVVVAVDGKSTAGVGPDGVRDLLKGPTGQDAVVTVRGANNEQRDIRITRSPAR
jgi:hypothetical protein